MREPRHHSITGKSGTISGEHQVAATSPRFAASRRHLDTFRTDLLIPPERHPALRKPRLRTPAPRPRKLLPRRWPGWDGRASAPPASAAHAPRRFRLPAITTSVIAHARSTHRFLLAEPVAPTNRIRSSFKTFSGLTVWCADVVTRSSTRARAAPASCIRFHRPPGPRLIIRKIELAPAPVVQNRLHRPPTRLHHVLPSVQSGIALHRIHQQRLVSRRRPLPKARPIIEIHRHRPQPHPAARLLRQKPQRNPLLRLNPDNQQIRLQRSLPVMRCKHRVRRVIETGWRCRVVRRGSFFPLLNVKRHPPPSASCR